MKDGEMSLSNSLRLPFHFAKRHGVFVESKRDDRLIIAHSSILAPSTVTELHRHFNYPLEFRELSQQQFENKLAQAYETGAETALEAFDDLGVDFTDLMNELPATEDLLESEDDAPIIRLLNALLTQAIKLLASDIHFETFEDRLIVRFRIDGLLREMLEPPRVLASLLVSRIKVMAKLDIAEKRLPQDGRISLRIAGRAVDVRVSTIPTHFGERVVLRLLDKQTAPLDLEKLGLSKNTLSLTHQLIEKPHGILLITGPTGSGKTTTLYAILTQLNNAVRNILTVEDPIEYYLQGIGQTQVNGKIGMTFARGLRAILRQDPDVVMVGEIRDLETAQMAVQASLTGHLVLSTLHTNSAIGSISRLRDMGIEPFLLSSTLVGVAAQRLVRLLCLQCKQSRAASPSQLELLGYLNTELVNLYFPVGCKNCGGTGYQGRSGLYELIAIDDTLSRMIHENESELTMEAHARQMYPSMRQDGWRRVLNGETTIEEVLRVTTED